MTSEYSNTLIVESLSDTVATGNIGDTMIAAIQQRFAGLAIDFSSNLVITPTQVHTIKHWHRSITFDQRTTIMKNMFQVIYPTASITASPDTKMDNLISYIKKAEGGFYELASSESEYCSLITETMCNMRTLFDKL